MEPFKVLHQGVPLEQAQKVILFLHGRGGTAENILTLSGQIKGAAFHYIAPQALQNSWYPYSFLEDQKNNEPKLSQAIDFIQKLIDNCSKYVPPNQLYLVGFSQGACLAIETACRKPQKYGGVIVFTGGLIGKTIDPKHYQGNFQETKIYLSNGEKDPHVPLERTMETKTICENLGAHVTLEVFSNKSHSILKEEIESVNKIYF